MISAFDMISTNKENSAWAKPYGAGGSLSRTYTFLKCKKISIIDNSFCKTILSFYGYSQEDIFGVELAFLHKDQAAQEIEYRSNDVSIRQNYITIQHSINLLLTVLCPGIKNVGNAIKLINNNVAPISILEKNNVNTKKTNIGLKDKLEKNNVLKSELENNITNLNSNSSLTVSSTNSISKATEQETSDIRNTFVKLASEVVRINIAKHVHAVEALGRNKLIPSNVINIFNKNYVKNITDKQISNKYNEFIHMQKVSSDEETNSYNINTYNALVSETKEFLKEYQTIITNKGKINRGDIGQSSVLSDVKVIENQIIEKYDLKHVIKLNGDDKKHWTDSISRNNQLVNEVSSRNSLVIQKKENSARGSILFEKPIQTEQQVQQEKQQQHLQQKINRQQNNMESRLQNMIEGQKLTYFEQHPTDQQQEIELLQEQVNKLVSQQVQQKVIKKSIQEQGTQNLINQKKQLEHLPQDIALQPSFPKNQPGIRQNISDQLSIAKQQRLLQEQQKDKTMQFQNILDTQELAHLAQPISQQQDIESLQEQVNKQVSQQVQQQVQQQVRKQLQKESRQQAKQQVIEKSLQEQGAKSHETHNLISQKEQPGHLQQDIALQQQPQKIQQDIRQSVSNQLSISKQQRFVQEKHNDKTMQFQNISDTQEFAHPEQPIIQQQDIEQLQEQVNKQVSQQVQQQVRKQLQKESRQEAKQQIIKKSLQEQGAEKHKTQNLINQEEQPGHLQQDIALQQQPQKIQQDIRQSVSNRLSIVNRQKSMQDQQNNKTVQFQNILGSTQELVHPEQQLSQQPDTEPLQEQSAKTNEAHNLINQGKQIEHLQQNIALLQQPPKIQQDIRQSVSNQLSIVNRQKSMQDQQNNKTVQFQNILGSTQVLVHPEQQLSQQPDTEPLQEQGAKTNEAHNLINQGKQIEHLQQNIALLQQPQKIQQDIRQSVSNRLSTANQQKVIPGRQNDKTEQFQNLLGTQELEHIKQQPIAQRQGIQPVQQVQQQIQQQMQQQMQQQDKQQQQLHQEVIRQFGLQGQEQIGKPVRQKQIIKTVQKQAVMQQTSQLEHLQQQPIIQQQTIQRTQLSKLMEIALNTIQSHKIMRTQGINRELNATNSRINIESKNQINDEIQILKSTDNIIDALNKRYNLNNRLDIEMVNLEYKSSYENSNSGNEDQASSNSISFETEGNTPKVKVINEKIEQTVDMQKSKNMDNLQFDISKLADQVYKKLESRLRMEKQRRGMF